MAYEPGKSPYNYNVLLIGAVAVVAAVVIFLIFQAGTGQQAGIDPEPPALTTPDPAPAPATPPAETPGQQ